MNANVLLRAEARKLVTTRSSVALVVVGALYGVLGVAAAAFAPESERVAIDSGTLLQIVRGAVDLAAPIALVLGILATAGEHRHGTIVPTVLATPRRGRLFAAKVGFAALVGAGIALVGTALAIAAGSAYIAGEDAVAQAPAGDVALAVIGAVVVTTVYGALGAAVGTLVRNQTVAITGAIVWLTVVEEMVPIILRAEGLQRWLLDDAGTRLLHLPNPAEGAIPLWAAATILAAAVVAVSVPAAMRATRSDLP